MPDHRIHDADVLKILCEGYIYEVLLFWMIKGKFSGMLLFSRGAHIANWMERCR